MRQYLELCKDVLKNGEERMDRTGTGTLSVFGRQLRFDLQDGFPAVTTKRLFLKGVWHELLMFLHGDTNIKYLQNNDVHIWDAWAKENGDVGPIYGAQWRNWPKLEMYYGERVEAAKGIDQLQIAIDGIKNNPTDRRMIVSAWNVSDLSLMALPPCHLLYQFYVRKGTYLDCQVYQRSADLFLGVPFDIASYATLMHMVAHVTGLQAGELIYNFGDTHIYLNHVDQVRQQLEREPYPLPQINVNRNNREIKSIDDFVYDDLQIVGYTAHGPIKGAISV